MRDRSRPPLKTIQSKASSRADQHHRRLFALSILSIAAVMSLPGHQLWSSHTEVIREAGAKTRKYASIFDTRLDGTSRRIDATLQILARTIDDGSVVSLTGAVAPVPCAQVSCIHGS